MAKRKVIDINIVKRLLTKSGNRCALPQCENSIYDQDDIYLGEIAHIFPVQKGGARFDSSVSDEYINSYKNLLLLCPRCHKKIDKAPKKYSAVFLNQLKKKIDRNTITSIDYSIVDRVAPLALKEFEEYLEKILAGVGEIVTSSIGELKEWMTSQFTPISKPDEKVYDFSEHATQIKLLKSKGHYKAVLIILENDKLTHWEQLAEADKYKLILSMGLTFFDLNDYKSAAPYLIQLSQFNHTDNETDGFVSIGYLLSENYPEAKKYAEKAIKENPSNPNAYVTLLKIKTKEPVEAPAIEIPENLKGHLIIQIAQAKVFEDNDQFKEACQVYATINVESIKEPLVKNDLKTYYAIALMQTIKHLELLVNVDHNSSKDFTIIDQAHKLFTESISYFKDTELYSSRYYIHINRGIANKLLQKYKDSEFDFRKAFELNNTYIPFRYLLMNSNHSDWETLFAEGDSVVFADEEKTEFQQIKAEYSLSVNRPVDSLKLLEAIRPSVDSNPGKFEYYYFLLADAYRILNKESEVLNLIEFLKPIKSLEFIYYFLETRVAISKNDTPGYETNRKELISKTAQKDQVWASMIVFDLLCSFKDFRNAHTILKPICRSDYYNEYSRKFIQSLFLAGHYQEAVGWINNYIQNNQEDEYLIDILSTIYDFCSRRNQAITEIRKFLAKKSSFLLQIKLALFYYGNNEIQSCKQELGKIGDIAMLNLPTKFQISAANIQCGNPQRGLEIAYQTRCENIQIFQTHMLYADLITNHCLNLPQLQPTTKIIAETFVKLKSKDVEKSLIISSSPKFENEISIQSDLAAKLLGCKLEDNITYENSEFTIQAIQSKYSYALNESLKLFPQIDTQQRAIAKFSDDSKSAEQNATLLQEEIKKASVEEDRFIEQQNEEGRFLEVIAQGMNENCVKFWHKQISKQKIPFIAIAGTTEIQQLQSLIKNESGFIFDIFSILLIHFSNGWAIIEKMPYKKFIASSIIRIVSEHISSIRQEMSYGEFYTLIPQGDKLLRFNVSAKDQREYLHQVLDLKAKLQQHFEIIEGQIPEDAQVKKLMDQQLGLTNADTLLAADNKNLILICDDIKYRIYVNQLFGINSFSLTNLIIRLKENKSITKTIFDQYLITLIQHNFLNVPTDDTLIYNCFILDNYKIGGNSGKALSIFNNNLPRDQRIRIVSNFTITLFKNKNPSIRQKNIALQGLIRRYFLIERSYNCKILLENNLESQIALPKKAKFYISKIITKIYNQILKS